MDSNSNCTSVLTINYIKAIISLHILINLIKYDLTTNEYYVRMICRFSFEVFEPYGKKLHSENKGPIVFILIPL